MEMVLIRQGGMGIGTIGCYCRKSSIQYYVYKKTISIDRHCEHRKEGGTRSRRFRTLYTKCDHKNERIISTSTASTSKQQQQSGNHRKKNKLYQSEIHAHS